MTTDSLHSFHGWLRATLPLSAGDIMGEIQILRRAVPAASADLPRDALELTAALAALQERGLAEKRDGLWYWKAEAANVEPQRALFV